MAHPRLISGSVNGDPEAGDPDRGDPDRGQPPGPRDPIGDLEEWRPPARGSWAARLATLEARAPAELLRPGLLVLAIVVLAGAGWWLLRPPAPAVETVLPLAEPLGSPGSTPVSAAPGVAPAPGDGSPTDPGGAAAAEEMVVQAAGAVGRPGVYRLPTGSRVDDLVREAGGLTPDSDADRVNLAAPLHDGERIWVPRVDEEEAPAVIAGSGGGVSPVADGPGSGAEAGPVNLNTATAVELEGLPGIGPATASAILAHRDQIGSFGSIDELIDVRGIGDAKLEQLRPLVTV